MNENYIHKELDLFYQDLPEFIFGDANGLVDLYKPILKFMGYKKYSFDGDIHLDPFNDNIIGGTFRFITEDKDLYYHKDLNLLDELYDKLLYLLKERGSFWIPNPNVYSDKKKVIKNLQSAKLNYSTSDFFKEISKTCKFINENNNLVEYTY